MPYSTENDTVKTIKLWTPENNIEVITNRPFNPLPADKVVMDMRDAYTEWIESLSNEEKKAFLKYTLNSIDKSPNRLFERINSYLRGELLNDSTAKKYADILVPALQRAILTEDIICYRNTDKNFYPALKEGDIFRSRQLISTSVTAKGALDKGFKTIILAHKGTQGAYIENVSKFPKQREFLINKDVIYSVLYHKDNKMIWEVVANGSSKKDR